MEERKNYPHPNGGFYETMYDNGQSKLYKTFEDALDAVNEDYAESETQTTEEKIKLPKLKKHA